MVSGQSRGHQCNARNDAAHRSMEPRNACIEDELNAEGFTAWYHAQTTEDGVMVPFQRGLL